jgi:hypothetical protein
MVRPFLKNQTTKRKIQCMWFLKIQ